GVGEGGVEGWAWELAGPVPDGLLASVSGLSELSGSEAVDVCVGVCALHHVLAAVGVPPVLLIRFLNGLAWVELGEVGFCANCDASAVQSPGMACPLPGPVAGKLTPAITTGDFDPLPCVLLLLALLLLGLLLLGLAASTAETVDGAWEAAWPGRLPVAAAAA